MMTRCPECDQLVEIRPTGKSIGLFGSASYKEIVQHPTVGHTPMVRRAFPVEELCMGSGRYV